MAQGAFRGLLGMEGGMGAQMGAQPKNPNLQPVMHLSGVIKHIDDQIALHEGEYTKEQAGGSGYESGVATQMSQRAALLDAMKQKRATLLNLEQAWHGKYGGQAVPGGPELKGGQAFQEEADTIQQMIEKALGKVAPSGAQ